MLGQEWKWYRYCEATGIMGIGVGFVSTYNLDVSGISTFTGILPANAEFQHIMNGGQEFCAPSAVLVALKQMVLEQPL